MSTFQQRARRLTIAGGFALAVVAAPAIAVLSAPTAPMPLAQCMAGEVQHPDTGVCMPGTESNAPAAAPGNPDVPMVDGIPCLGHQAAECIGLEESQAGQPVP